MLKLKNNIGSTLAISIITIFLLTVWGQATLLSSIGESRVAQRHANSTQAFWLADAGVQRAVWEYKNNSCHGFVQQGTATACTDCTCANATKSLATTLSNGDYDVTLDFNNTIIQSIGSTPSRIASNRIQRKIQINLGGPSLFTSAAFANHSITISNNSTINGNLGTNGTQNNAISLGNNDTVNGNITTGVGGTVSLGNGAVVNGTITTSAQPVTLPNVVVPSNLTNLSSGGNFNVTSQSNLGTGNYRYTSINLSNGSILNITGNVRLYLDSTSNAISSNPGVTININVGANLIVYVNGKLSVSSNMTINNASTTPGAMQIYSTYSGGTLQNPGVGFSNNGNLYAAVYAPAAYVNINNNSNFYGSVIGNDINLNPGGSTHFSSSTSYDSALQSVPNPFSPPGTVSNWHES